MYRASAFIIAVGVLVGLAFSGGLVESENRASNRPDAMASLIGHSEQELQAEADQELADIDAKASQNTVLNAGQSAKQSVAEFIRRRME